MIKITVLALLALVYCKNCSYEILIIYQLFIIAANCASTSKIVASSPEPTRAEPSTQSDLHQRRHELMSRAKLLEKEAEAEIKVLRAEKKYTEANELNKEELNLKKLYSELVGAEEHHQLDKIENEVALAENRLKELIEKIKAHKTTSPQSITT